MDPASTAGLSSPTDPPSSVQVAQQSLSNTAPPSQHHNQSTNAPGFNSVCPYPQHLQQSQHQPQLQNWWAQNPQPPRIQSHFQYVQQTQPQNASQSIVTGWAQAAEEWLKKFWKRFAALLVMVGSILAIYYQVRADRRDEQNQDYAQRSWELAVWTAHKDYCKYQRNLDKNFDTEACLVSVPPNKLSKLKRWMYGNFTVCSPAQFVMYGEPTIWNIKQWMLGLMAFLAVAIAFRVCFSAMRSLLQPFEPRVSRKSAQHPPSTDEVIGPVESVQPKTSAHTRKKRKSKVRSPAVVVVHQPHGPIYDPNNNTSGASSGFYH